MKRQRICLIGILVIVAVACLCVPFFFSRRNSDAIEISGEASSGSGDDIIIEGIKPSDCNALQVWKAAESALAEAGAFSSHTEGYLDTQVLFFNYRQTISNRRVSSAESSFCEWISNGALLNSGVQVYSEGAKKLIRTGNFLDQDTVFWADAPHAVSEKVFADAMVARCDGLSFYDISEDTILLSSFVSDSNGVYRFSFQVDGSAFSSYAQMLKTLNGFESIPAFESAIICLEVDEDFRPLSVSYEEQYSIQMSLVGETSCVASYKEIFSYDRYDFPEEDYFLSFMDLREDEIFPVLPGGYDLLFSLFGNNLSYNLNITGQDRELPLLLNFDASRRIIHLQGEALSLVYANDRYYLSYEDIKASVDAAALEKHFLPLSVLNSRLSGKEKGNQLSSFMEDVSVSMENGKIVLQSENSDFAFLVEVDAATMTIYRAEFSISFYGSRLYIDMEQSSVRGVIPDLSSYQDITSSMSAFSMLRKLNDKGSSGYHLSIDGTFAYDADVILTINDAVSASILSARKELPLDFYLYDQDLTIAFMQTQIKGSFEELGSLFSLVDFATPVSTASSIAHDRAKLHAEQGKVTLCLNGATFVFEETVISYSGNGFFVSLSEDTDEFGDAKVAPETSNILTLNSLCRFLDGSVYLDIIGSESIFCDLIVFYDGQSYPAKGCLSLEDSISFGISSDVEGGTLAIVWHGETLYISHPVSNMFVSSEHLAEIPGLFRSLISETELKPFATLQNENVFSVNCDGQRLCLYYGGYTIVFDKECFAVQADNLHISGDNILCSSRPMQIVTPDINSCIDVYELLVRLQDLVSKDSYSFEGNLVIGKVTATINSLCLQLDETKGLKELLADLSFHDVQNSSYRLYYDGEYIYLDTENVKLFAWADQLLPPLMSLVYAEPIFADNESAFSNLSAVKKIMYSDDVLSIVTVDGILVLSWMNGRPYELSLYQNDMQINLLFTETKEMTVPSIEEYVDVSEIGELLVSVAKTIEAGSFSFDGVIDLNFLSVALTGVRAQGSVYFGDGDLSAHMLLQIPYLYGVTSDRIPLLHGENPLLNCQINVELFIADGRIYVQKTIVAMYGLSSIQKVEIVERRYVSLEQFLSHPNDLLSFVLNLEQKNVGETVQEVSEDASFPSLLEKFSSEGTEYTFEINPETIFPIANEISITMETDERYLTDTEVKIALSVVSLSGRISLRQHGQATVFVPDKMYLSLHLPLHE